MIELLSAFKNNSKARQLERINVWNQTMYYLADMWKIITTLSTAKQTGLKWLKFEFGKIFSEK